MVEMVPGVYEKFGEESKKFRDLVRSIEDIFDNSGFDQLMPGLLAHEDIFRENLAFLGERFLDNLVYVSLNGEADRNVVVLPEGTMRTYDFIARKGLERAKIFYSQQFVRNEPPEEVLQGKTRNFWQAGCEIFGYDWLESSREAITITYDIMAASGLSDARIRFADKRLFFGLTSGMNNLMKKKILALVERSDDDPDEFCKLCEEARIHSEDTRKIQEFLAMNKDSVGLDDLRYFSKNPLYQEGISAIEELSSSLPQRVNVEFLPFMAKSWDACDKLLFDARVEDYGGALAGGGNLFYNNYRPDLVKSGMGVGVTRLFDVQKQRNI